MNSYSIGQIVPSINEQSGGVSYYVSELAAALSKENIDSHVFTLNYPHRGKQLTKSEFSLHSQETQKLAYKFRGFQPDFANEISKFANQQLDLIHNHGLWMFPHFYARKAAVKHEIPLVISTHGTLAPWSLRRSRLIKSIVWLLSERKNLNSASLFHATSLEELQSIRRLNLKQPVAVIPVGLELPKLNNKPKRKLLINSFPELKDKQWLLFLSRIHPVKGIDNLLYSWKSLSSQFPDWHLIIAGPDSIGYKAQMEKLTSELELDTKVTFTGMLTGIMKASALSNADLFVLPSHTENFGIAVVESLSYEVPVITTKGTPWEQLNSYACGCWIDDDQSTLEKTLLEVMSLSLMERKKMGQKGRQLIAEKYSWDVISKDMVNVYHWILGECVPPPCVHFYHN
jgi:glycosyltransferase involved in cell wall biosynthesis